MASATPRRGRLAAAALLALASLPATLGGRNAAPRRANLDRLDSNNNNSNGGGRGQWHRHTNAATRSGWDTDGNWVGTAWPNTNDAAWPPPITTWGDGPDSCGPSQCFVPAYRACLHITSLECRNPRPSRGPTPPPSREPTGKPTFAMAETTHNVQIAMRGVPEGYRIEEEHRAYIIRSVKERLEAHLHGDAELVSVEGGGRLPRNDPPAALPLKITVRSRANVAEFALTYVMDVVRNHLDELENELRSLDWYAFKDVRLSADTYNPEALREGTDEPTPRPTPRPAASFGLDLANEATGFVEETSHSVRLVLENLPEGYRFSREVLAKMASFVEDVLEYDLEGWEVVDVALGDSRRSLLSTRRLHGQSLPMVVTVRGPPNREEARSSIVDALVARTDDLEAHLRKLDRIAFRDAEVSVQESGDAPVVSGISTPLSEETETVWPVKLRIHNARPGYRLSVAERVSIVQYVQERIEASLDDLFELVDASYAPTLLGNRRSLRGEELELPLLVRVRGPASLEGVALMYVVRAIRDASQDIEAFLETLDGNALKIARVYVETYESTDRTKIMGEESSDIPGWVWFFVAMFVLVVTCLCCCACYVFALAYKKHRASRQVEDELKVVDDATVSSDRSSSEKVRTLVQFEEKKAKPETLPNGTAIYRCEPVLLANNGQLVPSEKAPQAKPWQSAPSTERSAATDEAVVAGLDEDGTSTNGTSVRTVRSEITFAAGDDPPERILQESQPYLALPLPPIAEGDKEDPSGDSSPGGSSDSSVSVVPPVSSRARRRKDPSPSKGGKAGSIETIPPTVKQVQGVDDRTSQISSVDDPHARHKVPTRFTTQSIREEIQCMREEIGQRIKPAQDTRKSYDIYGDDEQSELTQPAFHESIDAMQAALSDSSSGSGSFKSTGTLHPNDPENLPAHVLELLERNKLTEAQHPFLQGSPSRSFGSGPAAVSDHRTRHGGTSRVSYPPATTAPPTSILHRERQGGHNRASSESAPESKRRLSTDYEKKKSRKNKVKGSKAMRRSTGMSSEGGLSQQDVDDFYYQSNSFYV